MPRSTQEVRWFFPGALDEGASPQVETWFRTRPVSGDRPPAHLDWEPVPPRWRPDRYLVVPGQDDIGIKSREGRLEIKGREVALGRVLFAPGIEGWCERWLKWSYAGPAIERRFRRLFREGHAGGVVTVEKRRLQRCVSLGSSGIVEVGPDEAREHGINIELAQIRVPGSRCDPHWSLAFEAFPGERHMAEPLAQVVAGFLEGCPALPLGAEQSMAYPRWLLGFDRPPCRSAE